MKTSAKVILITMIFVFLFSYCEKKNIDTIIETCETLVDINPDSAYVLLDDLQINEYTNPRILAEFVLLYCKATDKLYKKNKYDSLLVQTIETFRTYDDIPKLALANYYAGRIAHNNHNLKNAAQYYLASLEECNKINDNELKARNYYYMGAMHQSQFNYTQAINSYTESERYFDIANNNKYKNLIYISIADCYNLNQKSDSAFIYYDKAIEYAKSSKNEIGLSHALKNKGIAYRKINKNKEAIECIKQSFSANTTPENKANRYITLAYIFKDINENDSARYYQEEVAKISKHVNDHLRLLSIYLNLSQIEEQTNNYKEALGYYKLYTASSDSVISAKKQATLIEVEKKYNNERLENLNNKLLAERLTLTIFIVILVILIIGAAYIINNANKKKEQRIIQAETTLETLNRMVSDYEAKDNKLKKLLLHNLEVSKKVALMHAQSPDKSKSFLQKFNEVMYGEQTDYSLNWQELYETINELYDNFELKLSHRYPNLTDKEIQLCCLLKAEFRTDEIAFILQLSVYSIHKRKTDIRKKLSTKEGEDIITFLNEQLK